MGRTVYSEEDLQKAKSYEFTDEKEDMFSEEVFALISEDSSVWDKIVTAYRLGLMVGKGVI